MIIDRLLKPFLNRKAISEEANGGISFTASLIVTLIALSALLALFTLFLNNAKKMQDKEKNLRQMENDSISLNDSLPIGVVLDDVIEC